MSADLQRELERLRGRKADEATVAAWRRLRTLKDGLKRELALRTEALGLRETDTTTLADGMRLAWTRAVDAALGEAEAAEATVSAHVASGGRFASLSRTWRRERDRLAGDAASKRKIADDLVAGLPGKEREIAQRAKALAAENHRQNEKSLRPLAPLRDQLADMETALAAVEAGDGPAIACLARWDLEALVQVARIWRRIRDDGFVSDADWVLYRAAQRVPEAASHGGPVLLRRVTEEIVVMPEDRAAASDGTVIDGDFTEVRPGELPAIPDRSRLDRSDPGRSQPGRSNEDA